MSNAPPTPLNRLPSTSLTPGRASAAVLAHKTKDEFRLLVNSRHPLITVETSEESRVEELLHDVAEELSVPLFVWSVTTGLARQNGAPIYHTEDADAAIASIALIKGDALFMLKDFARYCEQDKTCRRLRELAEGFRDARRSIIISGPSLKLPAELENDAVAFRLDFPDTDLLLQVVHRTLAETGRQASFRVDLDTANLHQLAQSLQGLTSEEARRTLTKCLLARGRADAALLADILEAKRQILRRDGVLEYVKVGSNFSDVAGLRSLKKWLKKREGALTLEGQTFGLEPPKGVLITGVQGCGKSMAAKAIAGEWRLELAKLDAGALYDKYIGESEKRLTRALSVAEQLAPIVLWIDEIEKGFAATSASSDVDGGLSQRLLATFLTWLQDRQSGVFIAATSNNLSLLPPELLRKGRFDEIFFVDLPGADVRAALFEIHLRRRGRDPGQFDLKELATASEGFSGAEIEQSIVAGLYTAFSQKQLLSTAIILAELHATRPLSVTRAEDIAALRVWARDRAAPAD
ncbi:MAG TPA: AAA family ATPase [Candidatus Dormibacteraeota bacterium]|nr:AAA family ATPase [Candidatus Dormibacteraeota bacterium]